MWVPCSRLVDTLTASVGEMLGSIATRVDHFSCGYVFNQPCNSCKYICFFSTVLHDTHVQFWHQFTLLSYTHLEILDILYRSHAHAFAFSLEDTCLPDEWIVVTLGGMQGTCQRQTDVHFRTTTQNFVMGLLLVIHYIAITISSLYCYCKNLKSSCY